MKYKGVIEGFYGKPWSISSRKNIIKLLKEFGGLNTYLYAPKDDLKQRYQWRSLYNDTELLNINNIIKECKCNKINFIYAISPGYDIKYSSKNDYELLKNKIKQLYKLNIDGIAVLFDDIPEVKYKIQKNKKSFYVSHMQTELLKRLTNDFNLENWFFCPTVYSFEHINNDPTLITYLTEINKSLDQKINLFWTGNNVISTNITKKNINNIKSIIKNPIIIWDNLFANDYDLTRCHLGPYSGREEISNEVDGILLNPNCEAELNFIHLMTFSDYCQENKINYNKALNQWYEIFEGVITIKELELLCDIFHLPNKLGEKGYSFIKILKSKKNNDLLNISWKILKKLSYLKNRDLYHSIYPYAWHLYSFINKNQKGLNAEFLNKTGNGSLFNYFVNYK